MITLKALLYLWLLTLGLTILVLGIAGLVTQLQKL